MSNVKAMVGQTWYCSMDRDNQKILSIHGAHIEWANGTTSELKNGKLDRTFKFVPANDLEWLAVNVEDWKNGAGFICKFGSQVEFRYGDSSSFTTMYNRKEWCDMRIKLGLELDVNMVNISKEDGVSGKPAVDYLADITRIVASTSHLPAIETGKAVIEYLNKE